ncbi:class I SAM-dependent methyltransferase [Vibrio cholerae]|uniref:class I SAM-dependent methyltransferase n=1 Tax=Vibrio cholerae TaxID=666 RepID=UPI0004E2FAAE|nr:class I SAM-dependent methyltransferase [Vibrio cholerae]EGR2394543.1 class I SAM-dependent methyltransferase [Vibrio cholerae]EJL6343362.1 class I SAM-dependent methyltransferase [Vibrio cholerae]EKF9474348.1 class I SAM-dependent methyltransferase [Vibrio cholerae]EKF9728102.1 class I SAM-dependent methyltransferase [Vibrio cholerae]KFE25350.1 ubiE/COQ5 methyltransferase family protein [Vibrio cholerae]
MSGEYNSEVSKHYAVYRPPIHSMILEEVLPLNKCFSKGLDVGCGTGVSTKALSRFCKSVIGIDPSKAMLAQAKSFETIMFMQGTGENIPLADNSIDIVSFAGSLFYAKSSALISELVRVCSSNALVVVYDFEVKLDSTLNHLGIKVGSSSSGYNHSESFEGYSEFQELKVREGKLTLSVTSEQLGHILFSSSKRYSALVGRFGDVNPFALVIHELDKVGAVHEVGIDTYYSMYQMNLA